MKKNSFIFLRETFGHMGGHSGYDIVFEKLEEHIGTQISIFRDSKYNTPSTLQNKILFKIFRFVPYRTPSYNTSSLLAELKVFLKAKIHNVKFIHVGYLEDCYGILANNYLRSKLKSTQIIATAHQPVSWWKLNGDPNMVRTLDGLIVVSSEQKEYFENYLPGKVYFIHHGVDINFFKPKVNKQVTHKRCVFSGVWLRDLETLVKVISEINKINPEIHFDIIYPKTNRQRNWSLYNIARLKNTTWHSNLSDFELREVYQNGQVLVLPLIDSTANNALLEGMAIGLHIVTTDLPGVRDYVNLDEASLSPPGNVDNMVQNILNFYKQKRIAKENSISYVKDNFNWNSISFKHASTYSELMTAKNL